MVDQTSSSNIGYEVVEGLRKNSKLYRANSFLYYKNKVYKNKIALRCLMYPTTGCSCKASITIDTNEIIIETCHNHEPELYDEPMRALKKELKDKSETISESSRQIFDNVCRMYSEEVPTRISFPMVVRGMTKRKHLVFPKIPEDVSGYVKSITENTILNQHYKGPIFDGDEVIGILFFSTEMVDNLPNFDSICYDGTFFIVPKIFSQLFIISVRHGQRMLPTFFVLMKSRQYQHYKLVIQKIKDVVPQFLPSLAIGDFEKAPIRAFREIFSQITCQGCYFHFKQAIVRKLGELGLKYFFIRNKEFNQLINLIMALGFLPSYKIRT